MRSQAPPSTDDLISKMERHARFWDALKKIFAALLVIGTPLIGVVLWVLKTPTQSGVETAINLSEARQSAESADEKKSIVELGKQVAALTATLEALDKENNRRFDKLDVILEKAFGQSTAVSPPPAFGPKEKRLGR